MYIRVNWNEFEQDFLPKSLHFWHRLPFFKWQIHRRVNEKIAVGIVYESECFSSKCEEWRLKMKFTLKSRLVWWKDENQSREGKNISSNMCPLQRWIWSWVNKGIHLL